MLKTVIIDDEYKAVKTIELILKNHCKNIEVCGTANSVKEGIAIINKFKPDIVFLDIEMPEANGFDLLEQIDERDFEVIFITAYNHYAIRAIKYSAFDYILKPVDIDEISKAIENVKKKRKSDNKQFEKFEILLENIQSKSPKKLAIPIFNGTEYIDIDKIIRIEADGSYSNFYLVNKIKYVVSRNLKEYADILEGNIFYRIHRSHLINLNYIRKHVKHQGGYIVMEDDSSIPVSRQKKDEFKRVISNFNL